MDAHAFNGTTPVFHSLSQWNINAAEGTWSVGRGNNYVMNPNFEADRIFVANITGWTNMATSGSNPNSNAGGSHTPGRYAFTQTHSSAYQARASQDIKLPNGTYTLSAWVKSSGNLYFFLLQVVKRVLVIGCLFNHV